LLDYRLAHKAHEAVGDGRGKGAKPLKALKARTADPRSAVRLGDVALDRIEKLLADGRLDGEKERRMLLEYFPYSGTTNVLARRYARSYSRNGEHRKAKTAVERAIEAAGPNLEALRIYAEALQHEGDTTGAVELYRQALSAPFQ